MKPGALYHEWGGGLGCHKRFGQRTGAICLAVNDMAPSPEQPISLNGIRRGVNHVRFPLKETQSPKNDKSRLPKLHDGLLVDV
jgi:hypothetical protein